MKSAFRCFQIVLLLCGVFGADEDEVKSVSVMEGDPVTLNPDLTQIQEFNLLEWKFEDPVIAQTDGKTILYPNPTEIFRDRLQLDQTGSLTIKNMKTRHSGLYKLQISHNDGTTDRKFSVTVYESASDAGESELKSVSLMKGDPVTLQTDVTQLSGDELIVWRFGDEGKVIAKADIEAKSSPLYYDERFRDRLELDHQTGSLIITNTRTTDSGHYTVKISSRTQTSHQKYVVTISEPGLSLGAVAGIVFGFLLFVAAAAVGVIYYRRKMSELRKQMLPVPVTVTEGVPVALKPDKEVKEGDEIQWLFRDEEQRTRIAKYTVGTRDNIEYDDNVDERFRGRLKLNKTTGSLTITDSRTAQSGLYTLKIKSSRGDSEQRFILIITVPVPVTVREGEPVILKPDKEVKEGDEIQWLSRDEEQRTRIAKYTVGTRDNVEYDDNVDRFRYRLDLDKMTGSLTIRNCRPAQSGPYTLQITSSRGVSQRIFILIITEDVKEISAVKGGSVTLNPDPLNPDTEIQRDDQIQWTFGYKDSLIAHNKGGTGEICEDDVADGRFSGRLKLDETTGSLIITDISAAHTGLYKLKISSRSRETLYKKFRVFIPLKRMRVITGGSVRLSTDLPKIERDDEIQWMFGDDNSLIAEIKRGAGETYYVPDGRFSDVLELDKTGSLTIKKSRAEHAGDYKLNIRSRRGNTNKTYRVTIRDEATGKPLTEGKNGESTAVEMRLLLDK